MDELKSMYDAVWCVDFEFATGESGADASRPICMVATDAISGRQVREWLWGRNNVRCPISLDDRNLYVAYYLSAETGCHKALGWPMPESALDLHLEFRQAFNGMEIDLKESEKAFLRKNEIASLRACLFAFGLAHVARGMVEKKDMQMLCARGGPFTEDQRDEILDYCAGDTTALVELLPEMWPFIDLRPAVIRGRYMVNLGAVERHGVPLDYQLFNRLKKHWPRIVDAIIEMHRDEFDVIGRRDIHERKFVEWVEANGLLDWPKSPNGRLRTDRNTLSELAKYDDLILRLKEFLGVVRSTKLFADLKVGSDGRNRAGMRPCASATGRNQPSNAQFIFGFAKYIRHLIQPDEGHALLHADFSGQEYAEAAIFSGDEKMMEDYYTDDAYLAFAKRLKLVPPDATKKTHPLERDRFKVCCGLGVIYGAGAATVAQAGKMDESLARFILREHKHHYPTFWEWRDQTIDRGMLHGMLETPLGWKWPVPPDAGAPSISNFLMQGGGADMLRLSLSLAVEAGLDVCCPIHDALLIQCRIEDVDDARSKLVDAMQEASEVVTGGHALKIGVDDPIVYPDHYRDERGTEIWGRILELLERFELCECSQTV